MNNTLPIGSVVKLSGDSILPLMVAGYFPFDAESEKYYDYSGFVYPSGINESTNIFLFNEEDINEILYTGYTTESAKGWIRGIEQQFAEEQRSES